MLTDVPGLYTAWPDRSSLATRISTDEVAALLPSLDAGMIPRWRPACAVRGGVSAAHVIDGREPHAVLARLLSPGEHESLGTTVEPGEEL